MHLYYITNVPFLQHFLAKSFGGEILLDKWTGKAVALMHMHQITGKELLKEIGWSDRYLTMVLNCHRTPKMAKEKVMFAINKIVEERKTM